MPVTVGIPSLITKLQIHLSPTQKALIRFRKFGRKTLFRKFSSQVVTNNNIVVNVRQVRLDVEREVLAEWLKLSGQLL